MPRLLPRITVTILLLLLPAPLFAASDAEDAARWDSLRDFYFKDRPIADAGDLMSIEAPPRAYDAALVPVRITVDPSLRLTALSLIVDNNPVPLAATVHFGPAAAGNSLETRVRVNEYTNIHAVGEAADGRLVMTRVYVKAAGGCSAPALKDPEEALARIGRMKLKFPDSVSAGEPVTAQLLISHPNSSGLQFDQISRSYIPAHYIQRIAVSTGGRMVLEAKTDISISEDPSFIFRFMPQPGAPVEVEAHDSRGATFKQSLPVPVPAGPAL